MHSVVCLKQVPDTAEVRIDPKTNNLIREGIPSIINPYDVHALEEALHWKDQIGGKVTVISMGPPQAEEALKKAISLGADEAILLSDRAFAGADTLATSYVLAQAITKIVEREKVDLVWCGKQAIDGDTAQVGPGIAARLGMPQITYVMKVDTIDTETGEIQAQRKLEDAREILKAKLPALLTVVKDINEIRYASLPNMIRAARYKITVWNADDIGAKREELGIKGSPTTVNAIFAPPQRPGGEIIPGGEEEPEKAAARLVEKLLAHEIVANL